MSSALMFPHQIRAANLIRATSQRGQRPNYFQAGANNLGSLNPEPRGTGYVQALLTVVGSGEPQTATVKLSLDGGVTQLGRQAHTTWDGNGASSRRIYTNPGTAPAAHVGEIIAADLDGDGAEDTLFCPVTMTTPVVQTLIYKSADLSGTGSWTLHGTVPLFEMRSICWHPTRKRFYGLVTTGLGVSAWISIDGATWYALTTDGAFPGTGGNIIALPSSSLAICYSYLSGANYVCAARTSVWGTTWGAERVVSATSVNLISPRLHQVNTGETIMAYLRNTTPVGARMVWFANLENSTATGVGTTTMFADNANHNNPSVIVAPDRTIYYCINNTTSGQVEFSSLKGDSGTFPAVSTLRDVTNALGGARLSVIGGALFCSFVDTVNGHAELVMTKYWTAYSANPSWTGWVRQWLSGDVWAVIQGGTGIAGDTYTLISSADFAAHRMHLATPSRPARSSGDNVEWEAVFDAGSANSLINVDTICSLANFGHLHVQLNATDAWTSPAAAAELSHVRATIVAANRTLAGCKATLTGGATLKPHHHKGELLRFGTSGGVYPVSDNVEGAVWCDGYDIDGETGDLQVLSRRRWVSITAASLRYLRVLIEQQLADESVDYYELMLAVGLRTEAIGGIIEANPPTTEIIATDYETRSGSLSRTIDGPPRRAWELGLYRVGYDKFLEIKQQILGHGSAPFVLIPDVTDPYDWAYVLCETKIKEDPDTTTIKLVEVT